MKILSWNCRSLGNLRAVQALDDLLRQYKPDVVFLIETLVDSKKIEELRKKLHFDFGYGVSRTGRSGGLAVLSRLSSKIVVTTSSHNYVNVKIYMDDGFEWLMTCFYGYPEKFRRHASWELLKSLDPGLDVPWLVIGDFNDLACSSEKIGGNDHPTYLLNGFRSALQHCDLHEIEWLGYSYTWERSRGSPNWVREKLDRAVANTKWFEKFENAIIKTGVSSVSDHSPIILSTDIVAVQWHMRRFRFENSWV